MLRYYGNPTISHQLRGLEEHLGFALFHHLHRRVALTEVGEVCFANDLCLSASDAAASFGVALGPDTLMAEDIASGHLVAPFGFVSSGLAMYVLYPRTCGNDPRRLALRDWLIEVGQQGSL